MSGNDLVRIKYWYQPENGQDSRLVLTGLMPRNIAEQQAKNMLKAEIIESEEYEH